MSDRAGEWVTVKEAARLLGVHYSASPKMVRRGDLTPRRNKRPSLSREAVLELREVRAEQTRLRALPPASKKPPAPQPPDDERARVDAATVAAGGHGCPPAGSPRPVAVHDGLRRADAVLPVDQVDMALRAQEATRRRDLAATSKG